MIRIDSTSRIVLLTPTRDRPESFEFCERWMARQTIPEPVRWIVVDDGESRAHPTMGQEVVLRAPSNQRATLSDNIIAGLEVALSGGGGGGGIDVLLQIEDDDWYGPEYVLHACAGVRAGADVYGVEHARYYHVPSMSWRYNASLPWACLCGTAFGGRGISVLDWAARSLKGTDDLLVDRALHGAPIKHRSVLWNGGKHVCGLKGWPKRGQPMTTEVPKRFTRDVDGGKQLRAWIGAEDAAAVMLRFSEFMSPI